MQEAKPLVQKKFDRYGMAETEWAALTPDQRVVHYNRWRSTHTRCDHVANLHDWPVDLRESYSFDPYSHTAHMEKDKEKE